mgnify:FL=1
MVEARPEGLRFITHFDGTDRNESVFVDLSRDEACELFEALGRELNV